MRRKVTFPLTCLALLILCALAASASLAEEESVRVTNFPKVQSISGIVEMDKPAPSTRLTTISEQVVAPADPADAINLVSAGTLEAAGFRSVVISLAGQIKSNYPAAGSLGALLVPDTPFFQRAFEEDGEALLAMRVEALVNSESGSYFATTQPLQHLAFPRYRIYFFNTTERPASVELYAYLAN
jgi:hypothetical protein